MRSRRGESSGAAHVDGTGIVRLSLKVSSRAGEFLSLCDNLHAASADWQPLAPAAEIKKAALSSKRLINRIFRAFRGGKALGPACPDAWHGNDVRSRFFSIGHLCHGGLRVLVPKMTVDAHRQGATVAVAQEPRDSWDVDSMLDQGSRKQVPKIVMGEARDPSSFRRAVDGLLCFVHRKHR